MTSVGIMASAVVIAAGTDVLLEPFNNFTFAPWTLSGAPTIVAGRNGTCCQCVSSGSITPAYTIPTPNQDATVTIGFAYKVASLANPVHPVILLSDSGATSHTTLRVRADGSIAMLLGNQNGGILAGTSFTAPGVVTANTWNYYELQATLHDTIGAVKVRFNNTEVINVTGIDTKNAGTKTVYDTVRLSSQSTTSTTHQWDDLYIITGAGAPFKGDIVVP